MKMVEKAIEFALKAHKGQMRKGTNLPYIIHPMGVMNKLDEMGASQELICAGVLHDTIEDTTTTYEDIKKEFGEKVANLVKNHTDDKSLSWKERKIKALNEIDNMDEDTQMLILADKMDNAIGMLKKKDSPDFWKLFKMSKDTQSWYYHESIKHLAKLLESNNDKVRKAMTMYIEIVNQTFPK